MHKCGCGVGVARGLPIESEGLSQALNQRRQHLSEPLCRQEDTTQRQRPVCTGAQNPPPPLVPSSLQVTDFELLAQSHIADGVGPVLAFAAATSSSMAWKTAAGTSFSTWLSAFNLSPIALNSLEKSSCTASARRTEPAAKFLRSATLAMTGILVRSIVDDGPH